MSRPETEPVWQTIIKGFAAALLVLVALAFGAGGACGVWVAGADLWDTISRRGAVHREYAGIGLVIGGVCAAVGLSVAAMAVGGVLLMMRKKRDQDG